MVKETKSNPMRDIFLEKVTVNVCVGNDKPGMQKAKLLLEKLTGKTPVMSLGKKRIAQWQLRPGLPIGYKVTLRGEDAKKYLKWMFESKGKKLKEKSLDEYGNFSIGFHEYLDLTGMKYDAEIGILGFEVMSTFSRKGFRVKSRRLKNARIPKRHKVTPHEVKDFVTKEFGVTIE